MWMWNRPWEEQVFSKTGATDMLMHAANITLSFSVVFFFCLLFFFTDMTVLEMFLGKMCIL